MGGGKSSKAPKAPNYAALAQQQAEIDKAAAQEQTAANRPTQVGPTGKVEWTQDANGKWTQTTTQDPWLEAQWRQAQGLASSAMGKAEGQGNFQGGAPAQGVGAGANYGQLAPLAGAGMPRLGEGFDFQGAQVPGYDPNAGSQISGAIYEQLMGRARPEMEQNTSALTAQLRQQGLQPGSEAYDRAMKNLLTSQNDAMTQAGYQATMGGYDEAARRYQQMLQGQGQEFEQGFSTEQARANDILSRYGALLGGQGQQFGQLSDILRMSNEEERARAALNAQIQGQNFGQNLTEYNLPWQQMAQAQQMQGNYQTGPTLPGFGTATGYNPADMMGAAQNKYNANMGQYNAGQQKKGNIMNTGAQLGAAFMMSDENLKDNIGKVDGERALEIILGLNGYTYNWKDSGRRDMGVIAQEVERAVPELVRRTQAGILTVNYTELMALAIEAIKFLAGELANERTDRHAA